MSNEHLLPFRSLPYVLGAFETFHENVLFDRSGSIQGGLPEDVGASIGTLEEALEGVSGEPWGEPLREAVQSLRQAEQALRKPSADPSVAFLEQRREYSRALRLLYPIRASIPDLAPFWLLPSALGEREVLDPPAAEADPEVGLVDLAPGPGFPRSSLFVPESYTPSRQWPVVVALHGAYGRGDEYLFSWLRPAKSRGYIVVAPNSTDVTWSILQPPRDANAVIALLDHVAHLYSIDRERVLLTGLSDGGTFTYLTGLPNEERFRAIAPIAGDFHAMMDPMLRRKMGQSLPILIVHGARDPIFPVRSIRSAVELMSHLEYQVTYEELPDWGHAYPYSIHERLVLPWFESLNSS